MGIIRSAVVLGLVLGSAFQPAAARPPTLPAGCVSPTETTTYTVPVVVCFAKRIACIRPTSICTPGEPTGPTGPPTRTTTVTSPGSCTATVEIIPPGGCGYCASCTSGDPVVLPTTTSSSSSKGAPPPTAPRTTSAAPLPTSVNPGGPVSPMTSAPPTAAPTRPPPATSRRCQTTATVSTTVSSRPCACPAFLFRCPSGKTRTIGALPTSTVTKDCTVSVVAGPGCQCPVCA